MNIYSGPVFEMARQQFQVIADHIGMPEDERDRLLYPKRAITVSCPIHLDDGSTKVFQGYRVQHHLTLGPTKGGTAQGEVLCVGFLVFVSGSGPAIFSMTCRAAPRDDTSSLRYALNRASSSPASRPSEP